jgi:hypothetical protein
MTKIKSYPLDTNITGSDKWIGSDANQFNRTKNFSVAGLSDFYNSSASINMANSLLFFYDTVEVGESRANGSFSFTTEVGATVQFSDISSLVFSQSSKNGPNVVEFMESMVESIILIQKASNSNLFGFYKLTAYDQDVTETTFYNASLTFLSGNGSIEEDQDYFVSLLQFDTLEDKDKNYIHNQMSASSTWSVQHDLNKFPSVSVVDSGNNMVVGDVEYIDENNLTITFNASFSGKAYIN